MYSHYFFDLDKTLTRSRSRMAPAHEGIFEKLCSTHDVAVVTGGQISQIQNQIPQKFNGRYYSLSQSGNHVVMKDGTVLWSEKFTELQKTAILAFIKKIHDELHLPVRDEKDLIEDRGSQISYSLIGHHEDIEKKESFDPGAKKRLAILLSHVEDVERLSEAGAEVRTGGTTTLDFTPLGKNKGFNIDRFIRHQGWKKEESVYVGDALFPGGNDESVLGVMDTKQVNSPDETFDFIQRNLVSA